jgi:peptide/nickel transport system substrate-binding protein
MKVKWLIVSSLLIITLVLGSCAPAATPTPAPAEPKEATQPPAKEEPTKPPEPTATSVAIEAKEATPTPAPTREPEAKFKEAPMLADLVAAGKLPPVDERVSSNPLVTEVIDAIGKYGGTLQTVSWYDGHGNILLYISEPPIKWKPDMTGYEPALAESYEWSEDGKTFTMHLRKGVRWSDGEPYTTADWKFWWEDIANNPDYKVVSVPHWLRNKDGTPVTMEFPDDYTVVWKAADRSLWIDPYFMAQGFWEFAGPMMKPAHYLKQFHPKYNTSAKYEDLELKDRWYQNPEFPCLFAWCLSFRADDATRFTYSRNPYYWRVDTEGNQLPYIDKINVDIVADDQVRLLNAIQGRYDVAFRGLGSPNNIPLLQEGAEAGNYHLLSGWMLGSGAWPGYFINMDYVEGGKNYADDTPQHATEVRNLIRDKRFRQALSLGIDRQRVIDVVWHGIGEAKGFTLSPQSWHFAGPEGQEVYKAWAASYATTDYATANALLDEAGMVDQNGDGWRDLPSGKDFTLIIDVDNWGGDLAVNVASSDELKASWEANLKVRTVVNNMQGQPEIGTRFNEGHYMLRIAAFAELDIWTYPEQIFPVSNRYMWPLAGRWYNKGKDTCVPDPNIPYDCGMKPEAGSPAAILLELYDKGRETKDINARHKIVWEAIQLALEEGPFVLCAAGDQPAPVIAKNYMRNILDYGVVIPWAPHTPGNQNPSQWWIDQ